MNMPGPTSRSAAPARLFSRRLGLILGSLLLALPPALLAEGTVKTLGGGRLFPNGPDFGFADGDTLQVSQFNNPAGCAIDSSGRVYVADRDNGALRRLELAANRCRTLLRDLNQPVAVVIETNNVVYVLTQGDGRIIKLDRGIASAVAGGLSAPTAMAAAGAGQLYVAQSNGTVVQVNMANGSISGPLISGLNQPGGVAVLDSGLVAVSETGASRVRIWDPRTGAMRLQVGGGGAGFADGPATVARFNQPIQIAKAPGGNIIVADRGNHRVRLITTDGFVTTIYGVDPASWEGPACTSCDPVILPGWLDGSVEFAEAREPVGLAVSNDGRVYTTETYYHLVREVSGLDLSGDIDGGGGGTVVVLPPEISPNSGYYPMGTVIRVFNPNSSSLLPSTVYYTTDGSEPTTNSLRVAMQGDSGTLLWQEKQRDLTSLRLKAFLGDNASVVVSGQPANATELGIPQDVAAGIGSRVIVPVIMNLRTNDQIQSLQFRVEVTPESAAMPMIPETLEALSISTNDFIPLFAGGEQKGDALFQMLPYSFGRTRGLAITFIGTNSNLSLKSFGVPAVLALPIPAGAKLGERYTIEVLNPSGTADAAQQRVPIAPMPARSVMVTQAHYLVGDSSPGVWYNAAQIDGFGALRPGFGDGILDNSDVNNAFAAALGLRIPYAQTDLFDALDAYPEDTVFAAGGDGLIRYLDWQVILMRSLGLDPARWERSWSEGGVRVPSGPGGNGAASLPGTMVVAAPGAVWTRQAALSAQSVERVIPGALIDVPVHIQVASDCQLGGLAFRVRVEPEADAPPLERPIEFVQNAALPAPAQILVPTLDTVACGWPLAPSAAFDPPLRGRVLLGHVRLAVPVWARAGQVYTVRFANADGSPDLHTQYEFETRSASLWVFSPAGRAVDAISDEWKRHFFGTVIGDSARAEADPDGDGVSNGGEYAAGTNPIDPHSRLHVNVAAGQGTRGIVLRWLTAPGKRYQVESAPSLSSPAWALVAENVPGDGQWRQWAHNAPAANTSFYRVRLQPEPLSEP
jgi:hypothetical protein